MGDNCREDMYQMKTISRFKKTREKGRVKFTYRISRLLCCLMVDLRQFHCLSEFNLHVAESCVWLRHLDKVHFPEIKCKPMEINMLRNCERVFSIGFPEGDSDRRCNPTRQSVQIDEMKYILAAKSLTYCQFCVITKERLSWNRFRVHVLRPWLVEV